MALALTVAVSLPANVFGMAMERKGNAPFHEANYKAWKGTGIMAVINHPNRVYHVWCNGNEHFYYRGDAEALNDVLRKFAAVKLKVLEVVFRPGPGETGTFEEDTVRYDWQLHLLTGLAGHETPPGAEMDLRGLYVGERSPTLTVFIGRGNVELDKVIIPKGITFIGPGDLRKRYLQALKSKDSRTRGYAAYHLAELQPYNRENLPLIVALLKDKDAAWPAVGALGKMGKNAEEALPAIRRALPKQDKHGRKRFLEVIEEIRGAKDTAEAARFHREMFKLIASFQKTFTVTFPELTPEQTKKAEALIQEFSARQFPVRQEAVKKLIEMGPGVLPLVRKTLAKTDDAEVRLRCEMVLKGIAERFGTTPEGLEIDRKLHLPVMRVTIDAKNQSVRKVLESLAEQSGNRAPVTREPVILDHLVTLSLKDVPYWEGLDKLCEAAGLSYQLYRDRIDLRTKRKGEEDIGAYAGPVVIKVTACQRSARTTTLRTFRPFVATEPPTRTENDMRVRVEFSSVCEDRLPSISEGIRLVGARDSDGTQLYPPTAETRPSLQEYGRARLEWRDTSPGRKAPVTVSGVAEIVLALGRKELRIDDIFAPGQKPAESDGSTFLVQSAARDAAGIQVVLEVERPVTLPVLHHEHGRREYGFSLVSPSGKRYDRIWKYEIAGPHIGSNATSSDLRIHVRRWTYGKAGETQKFTMKLSFIDVPAEEGAWALVYDHPEKFARRLYPFTLKDIPMP
ncbi:MAG: hypothetical protein AMS16_03455 [Planctomycetes bacterium DG_58]|nr:MAG: hypothetical protein AMS16_03455 [Planctomycetes bacterium DG_58]